MNVKVLYFASARDLASTGTETLSVSKGTLVDGLAGIIVKLHPGLGRLKGSVRFSVNYVVVDGDEPLHDGDEVGVLPPIAGG